MGLLDGHNPYPGLKSVRPLTGDQTREGRVWAVVGFVAALMWLGGVASIVAVVSGVLARAQLRESRRARWFARLAALDIVLGSAGIVVALWWVLT